MKTMTCRQLGGPCDLVLRGATADEVVKLQDKHLRAVVADGDDAHKDALAQMKGPAPRRREGAPSDRGLLN
jgi:hypothetical protein